MTQLIEKIKAELKQCQMKSGYADVHTMLEHIWRTYTEDNPISNDRLRALNRKMDPILNCVPVEDSDKLFLIFWEFCEEYERASFLEGLRIGARLMMELQESTINN